MLPDNSIVASAWCNVKMHCYDAPMGYKRCVYQGCNRTWHHRHMTSTEKEQHEAREQLTALGAAYIEAEAQFARARDALNAGIVTVLKARTLGPSEVTRLVPYERQHVGRVAKAAGVPPLRERTVVSAKHASSEGHAS